MEITVGKIVSLLIAVGYTLFAIIDAGAGGLMVPVALLLPLALIWFPDEMGGMTGCVPRGYIDKETPAGCVSVMGWFFLVGFPVIIFLLLRR